MRLPKTALSLFLLLLTNPVFAESPIDPDEGRQHLNWPDAREAVGEIAFISGEIINVGNAGRVNFLNFDSERPGKFTGIIFEESLSNFPDSLEEAYKGKIVRIRGRVSLYRDSPQIVLTSGDQIEILDALPETTEAVHAKKPHPPAVAGQLTVATYNILNLFDSEDDPYHGDEGTPAKPREQLQTLADSIKALNADVIAFQEVENRFYLERFIEVFLPDMGYDNVVHFEGNDVRGIDVCLVSRVPIGPVRSHRHITFTGPEGGQRRFNRDVLAVTIEPPNAKPFEAWIVHLKSNSGGREFAEPVRLGEARQLRTMLDQQLGDNPDARIIVLGDFNDTWESETLNTIVGSGPWALWSAASDLEGELPDTFNSGEYRSMIDFILCSPAMAQAYKKGSFRVIPGSPESTGSDHNPVVATFRLE